MTKKEITEARVKHGLEDPKPEKRIRKKRDKKPEKPKGPPQVGLFGDAINPPSPQSKESDESTKQSEKKTRRTARKKRSHLNSQADKDGNMPKKKRYKTPVSEDHVTEYFKILAAKHGEKDWMESRDTRDVARSRLEMMLLVAAETLELVDDDYDFSTGRGGEVDGIRVNFVTLDQMTKRLEDISTLTSIGLL